MPPITCLSHALIQYCIHRLDVFILPRVLDDVVIIHRRGGVGYFLHLAVHLSLFPSKFHLYIAAIKIAGFSFGFRLTTHLMTPPLILAIPPSCPLPGSASTKYFNVNHSLQLQFHHIGANRHHGGTFFLSQCPMIIITPPPTPSSQNHTLPIQPTTLELDCLTQLKEYILSLGGDFNEGWECRAQVRDYGSRAGSIDTWFTAPDGEVYRSKVAAARSLGLDPSKGTNTKRPKSARKAAATSSRRGRKSSSSSSDGGEEEEEEHTNEDDEEEEEEEGGDGGEDEKVGGGGGGNTSTAAAAAAVEVFRTSGGRIIVPSTTFRPTDLTLEELGELLISMPLATDVDDCYEGLLFYKEAQLRHAAKVAARAAAAIAEREAAEREAADIAAAEAASLAEAEAREKQRAEREARRNRKNARIEGDVNGNVDVDADGTENGNGDVDMAEADADTNEKEKEEDAKEEEGDAKEVSRAVSRRNTRHSLANAVAAAAALIQQQSGSRLPAFMSHQPAHAAELLSGCQEEGGGGAEGNDATAADALTADLPLPGPPPLDEWDVELEVIRKCFVRVPVRLGRPAEDDPAPLSPTSRDSYLTDALLALSDGDVDHVDHDVDHHVVGKENGGEQGRKGAASIAEWPLKKFPLDQLTANEGAPSALHPAALFYLRYLEEEIDAEERALKREAEERAARKEAKRLEKQSQVGADGQPRPALPKPANLSLRGKSIEEVEEALMERLATYVADLGGHLPNGWRVKASIRQNGANAGGVDAYYYDPSGRRHKSMIKVAEVLGLEATSAAKPKTLASILGTGGKRGSRASAVQVLPQPPTTATDGGESPVPTGAVGGGVKEGGPQADGGGGGGGEGNGVEVAAAAAGDGIGGGDGEEDGSGRKTCGVCRTCLNPQLKKGCLVNRAKRGSGGAGGGGGSGGGGGGGGRGGGGGKKRSMREEYEGDSDEEEDDEYYAPAPPKKLTARQMAKIARLEREAAEKAAARAALEKQEEEDVEVEEKVEVEDKAPPPQEGEEEKEVEKVDALMTDAAEVMEGGTNPDVGEDVVAGDNPEPESMDVYVNVDIDPLPIADDTAAVENVVVVTAGGGGSGGGGGGDDDNDDNAPAAGGGGGGKKSGSSNSGGGDSKTTSANDTKRSRGGDDKDGNRSTPVTTGAAPGGGGGGSGGDDDDDERKNKRPRKDQGDGHGADEGGEMFSSLPPGADVP